MIVPADYVREIRKFATSQYWNSGLRITAGVMVPLVVLVQANRLAEGIPFLWGALFVSLTDTPGPVHHRRNGMVAAIVLNTLVVALTAFTSNTQWLLVTQIVLAAFFLTMAGVYGARAGAVGSLALVVMLLSQLSVRESSGGLTDSLLIAGGGTWYALFSLWLYRLRPYRPAEQALGENLMAIADYLRARASFYKDGADPQDSFNRVMVEQSRVRRIQSQTQDLLFKTRKFLSDASPKSRSLMMIYLDSLDLFEQAMHAYQDYNLFHKTLGGTRLLTSFYGLILQLAAEFEHVGLAVQAGVMVKRDVDLNARFGEISEAITFEERRHHAAAAAESLAALKKSLANARQIANGLAKLARSTRLDMNFDSPHDGEPQSGRTTSQSFSWDLMRENLTLKSNTFRHALRLTVAILVAYAVAIVFGLAHTYWVLLTIVTILRPVYALTRKRNVARLGGTLVGVVLVVSILSVLSNPAALVAIMIFSMLIGYSLLRLHYFGFVVFLTVFIIISFQFLNRLEFNTMLRERLIDTLIGSVIAFLAARFFLPVWGHQEIAPAMAQMLEANRKYFSAAWSALRSNTQGDRAYEEARQEAVVALTNLSEIFQSMLAEPGQHERSPYIHQFVIANHMLTGHIAALSTETGHLYRNGGADQAAAVEQILLHAETALRTPGDTRRPVPGDLPPLPGSSQLSMISTLSTEVAMVVSRYAVAEAGQ